MPRNKKLTTKRATALLEAVVTERPDYVNEPTDWGCTYTIASFTDDRGFTASCLVGHVVDRFDTATLDRIRELEVEAHTVTVAELINRRLLLTEDVVLVAALSAAQVAQDGKLPWSTALEQYRTVLELAPDRFRGQRFTLELFFELADWFVEHHDLSI